MGSEHLDDHRMRDANPESHGSAGNPDAKCYSSLADPDTYAGESNPHPNANSDANSYAHTDTDSNPNSDANTNSGISDGQPLDPDACANRR